MEIWVATKLAFKHYATFTGRTNRPDYWYFILALLLLTAIASVIDEEVAAVVAIATVIPWASATARRLRDTGKSMNQFFWLLVPFVGVVILLIQAAQPTVSERN